jgi:serine/threonine protein phosphatase PrpC
MQKETDVFAKIKAARERLQSKKNQPEAVQPSSEPENPLLKYYNPSKQQTPEQPINQPPIFSNPSQIPTPQTGRQGFSPLLKDMPTPPSPVPMPGTVGGTLDQFMPELPKGINPTETPSYSANGQSLTREQTAQTIKQSESTKNLGNLGVMNDPELERIKNSKILEAYNAPKPVAQAQKPKIDKAWYEDFVDGIHPSWEKVKSLGAKGISEAADLTLAANSGSGGVTPYLAKAMNYLEQKRLQASGIDNGIGAGLREYAADRDKEADELNETRDTESWGYKIGSVVPYTAGILAAVVTKPISAPVAGAIGLANVVGLSAVSFGSGIETYDEYKKDKGQESDPLARLGMGALYGSLEFGMERFALSKFIPASVQAKLSKSVIDVMGAGPVVEKTAKDLITDFANSSQSRATLVEGVLKSAGRGFVIEGSTEGATTFGQEFSNYLFQERKDWKKPIEILKESGEAFVLGGVMGVAIGPVSFAANRIENQQRRSAAETLVFAEMADNSGAVEIVGPAKSKPKTGQQATPSGSVEGTIGQEMFYNAIRANGTTTTVSENDINRVFQIKPETFTELLKGKYQGQALQENRANEAATQSANQESDTIRGEYQAMTFQGQDGVQMISAAQFNGEKVFVTAMFPDGNAVIQKPGEEKKVVSSLGLSEQETMPFDQFIETFGPVPEQTQVFDPANPIQIGEKIPIDGQEFSVSSVNLEEGIVQLENEDGTIFETIPVADFQQFRQPQQAEAAPQANEGAEKLRGMFTPKEDITPKPQQDEKISEERPVLEGLPGNRDEGQRGQEGAELRTQEGNKEEVIQNNPPTGAQESTVDNTIAADYLLTGGIGTILSTDYLLKGISGVFSKADKKITEIRNRYAKELAEKNLVDIKNLIGTETYNRMISEIREVIGQDYNGSEEIQSILDEVLKFPTGMPQRIGNQIESRLDRFENSQNEPATGAITPQSPDAPLQPAKPVTGSAQQPTPKNVPEKPVGQGADGAVQVRFPTHKVNVGQNLINNENVDKNGFVYFNSEKEAIDFANEVQKKTGDFLNVEKSDPIESILNDNPFLIGVKKEDSTEKLEKVKKELESDLGKYKEEDQGVFEELKDAITAIDLIISNRKNQPQPNEPAVQPAKPNEGQKGGVIAPLVPKSELKDSLSETARKQGFKEKDGVRYDRQKPIEGPKGKEVNLEFSKDISEKASYAVIESAQIQPSHKKGAQNVMHFIPEAQPKNRKTDSSQESARKIADKLDPEKISQSPNPYSGAPIVNSRGEVIQGNNRSDAIQQYWENSPKDPSNYRKYLVDNAVSFGLNPDDILGMKNPVLVRMTNISDARAIELGNYDVKDIESGGERRIDPITTTNKMSKADKKAMLNFMGQSSGNTLTEIVRDQVGKITKYLYDKGIINSTQLETILNKATGEVKPNGIEDISNIYKQFIFQGGDTNLPELFNAMPDRVQKALEKSIPDILNAPTPILSEIQDSITALNQFSSSGVERFSDWINQPDMFMGGIAPSEKFSRLSLSLVKKYDAAKTQTEIAKLFKEYNSLTTGTPGDLLRSPVQGISPKDAVKQVFGIDHDPIQFNVKDGDTKQIIGSDESIQDRQEPEPARGSDGVSPETKPKQEPGSSSAGTKPKVKAIPIGAKGTGDNTSKPLKTPAKKPKTAKDLNEAIEGKEGKTEIEGVVINSSRGDLEKDGYFAFNSNYSKGQDAVYADGKLFIVSDGMGSYAQSGDFAKDIVSVVSKIESFTKQNIISAISRVATKYNNAAATFSMVRKNKDGSYQYFSIGDSPIYVFDKDNRIVEKINESATTATDGFLAFDDRNRITNENRFTTGLLTVNEGDFIVVASDGFGDVFSRLDAEQKTDVIESLKLANDEILNDLTDTFKEGKKDDFSIAVIKYRSVAQEVKPAEPNPSWYNEAISVLEQKKDLAKSFPSEDGKRMFWTGFYQNIINQLPKDFESAKQEISKAIRLVQDEKTVFKNKKEIVDDLIEIAELIDQAEKSEQFRIPSELQTVQEPAKPNKTGKLPYASNVKLISKKETEIGTEYKFRQETNIGIETKVVYSDNPDIVLPKSFQTAEDFIKFKEDAINFKKSNQAPPKAPRKPIERPSNYGKSNKLVTEKEVEDAKKKLQDFFKGKGGKLYIGLDSEISAAALKYSAYHLEAGSRKFADFVRVMVEDFGQGIAPYLSGFYEQLKRDPDFKREGISKEMTPTDEVDDFDIDNFVKQLTNNQEDVSDRPGTSEQDQQDGEAPVQGDNESIPSDGGNKRDTGTKNEGGGKKGNRKRPGSKGSSGLSSNPSGKGGIIDLFPNESRSDGKKPSTGLVDGRGNSLDSPEGNDAGQTGDNDIDQDTQKQIESFANKTAKRLKLQQAAESIPGKVGDLDNIRETLPFLLPEQQEDVFKAENRFFGPDSSDPKKANGKGYLFTNGTGTGKTYTGLGILKRFLKEGKKDILIITPSQTKVSDWVKDAGNLGIKASKLKNTKDAGKGVSVTTFATFRANKALYERDFDLIVYDESHRLMEDKNAKESSTTRSHYMNSNTSKNNALRRLKDATGLWAKSKALYDEINSSEKWLTDSPNNLDVAVRLEKARQEQQKVEQEIKRITPVLEKRAAEVVGKTKVVFLSATPFKTVQNLRYANEVLFDWGTETTFIPKSQGMSRVDPASQFFLDNFGSQYEWKNNQLQTKSKANPEAIAMQEIAFNAKLVEDGVMSGRAIESDMDYRRDFPILTGEKSERFNEALEAIRTKDSGFEALSKAATNTFFNTNYTTQLLESMKATLMIPRMKEHIKIGRKIVIFHRRQQANIEPPFFKIANETMANAVAILNQEGNSPETVEKAQKALEQVEAFREKYADLFEWEKGLDYRSAVEQFAEAFGEQIRFQNGRTSEKDKKSGINVNDFNEVGGPVKIIMVQEESGKEGISLHDTSGTEQRVLVSLSMPRSSTTALQIEGRIYRIGVSSNAVYEYPVMGLDFEIMHFASNINTKLSTTENLAMGDGSRDLINSFIAGVQAATDDAPNQEQGIGGKELDKRISEERSQYRKAILYYQSNQKTRGRRDEREGVDFYATPEPVGQKMVEFLGLEPMEKVLEPSVGKGAIAMWFPGSSNRTIIEESMKLFTKASIVASGANSMNMRFEDFNIINKFHGVAMNPPFGSAGKTAMDHVEKAIKHLYDGGRVVALVPVGAMDKRVEAFMESKEAKNIYLRGEILLPGSTFEQAGTKVNTRILIFDKIEKPSDPREVENMGTESIDLRRAKTIEELFEAIEFVEMPSRIEVQDKKQIIDQLAGITEEEDAPKKEKAVKEITEKAEIGDLLYKEGKHTKTGAPLHLVEMTKSLGNYQELKVLAESMDGFYDRYSKAFRFKSKEGADKFIQKGSQGQANPDDVRFSKPSTASNLNRILDGGQKPTKKAQEITDKAAKFTENWNNAPEIVVLNNSKEAMERFPELEQQYSEEDINQVPALFIKDATTGEPKAVLIASHSYLSGKGAVEKAILHEVIGHYGVREFLKQQAKGDRKKYVDSYVAFMQQVFDAKKADPVLADISQRYFGKKPSELSANEQTIIGDEYLAKLAEDGVQDQWIDRAITKFRQILRDLGITLGLSDSEIRAMLGNSRRIVMGPNGSMMVREGIDQTNLPREMIIGEQGARKLDKQEEATIRIDNLGVAREMEAAGLKEKWFIEDFTTVTDIRIEFPSQNEAYDYMALPENKIIEQNGQKAKADKFHTVSVSPEAQIKIATGWEKGADGKWRYEVEDIDFVENIDNRLKASEKARTKNGVDLVEFVNDNKLFKAYPALRWIKVVMDTKSGSYGSFNKLKGDGGFGQITINPDKHQNDKQILSTLLHEIQHAIQQKEGFASGGNINDVALREKLSAAGVKTREELNEKIKTLKSEYKIIYNRWEDRAFAKRYKGQTEESRNLLREWQGINNQIKDLESNTYDFQKAFRLYQRIAGEVESRNVESRANLSLEERRTQTLQSTEDVSREDQIFLENASGPAMSMTQPQTQSAAFKKWFGDSKVVDSNGEPLVVYHGTEKKFTAFRKGSAKGWGDGIYFTDNKTNASEFGENVMDSYLSIKNPIDGDKIGQYEQEVTAHPLWKKEETRLQEKYSDEEYELDYNELISEDFELVGKILEDLGYDGVISNNSNSIKGKEIVVFSPTQIKSATGNSGAFDGENSDIRFMRVGSTEPDFTAINVRNFNEAKLSWFERKVIEPLQDRMIRSKKLIQSKTGGNVSDAADFYTKENLASGKTLEKARVFIKDLWKPLIKTANKIHNDTGLASEDISNYIKFKHHAERKAYFMDEYAQLGKAVPIDDRWPTGMTDEEAADGIAAFETSVDKAMIDQLNQQVRAISHFTSMERYESGMITKETFDDLMTRYENYVPLTDWSGMESTNDKVYTLLMSAKGRTSESADPLPFLFTAAQESIMRGEKNRTKQSVLEFVKENVSPGNYFIRNAFYLNTKMQDENGNDIWIETMNKPTAGQLANGDAIRSFDPAVHRHVQQQGDQVAVLDVMVKGKKVFIEFKDVNYNDPKAAKYGIVPTIKNMNQDQVPGFFEKLRPYTRWLSSMYTQYNPEFGIRNLIRDVGFGTFNILVEQDATIARKTIGKMGKSAITLGKFLKNDEYPAGKDGQMLREFMEEGALTGYTDLQTAAEVFAQTKKEIDKADKEGIWRRGGNAAIKPIQLFGQGLEIYNKTMENSMRFSYYKTLRDEGMSKQQSAAKAKDLTVNFNRKGRSSGVMGTIFIFFNASVQGTERLARSFTNPKTAKKALGYAGGIMAAGMMQSLLLGMLDEEDEDGRSYYEKIPDYVRKNHVILPNLFSDTPGDYIKIPLPYGLNIFYAFGESIGRTMMGKSDIEKEAMGMLGASTNVFSPIGGYDFTSDQNGFQQAMMLASPSVIQPLADLGFNRNFAGRPIYRENFTTNQFKLPDNQMYFEGVNPFIKESTTFMNKISGGNEVVSGKIDINPEWLEYGMEQYLGGPVQFTKNIATTVAEVISGENILEDPFIRKVPFVRSFVQKTGSDFEARASFYENRDKAITAVEAFEKMQEAGLSEDAAKFYDKNKGLIGLSETYKGYERLVKDLNKIIGEMKSADKELYKDDIEKLYEDRTKIMRGFNREYGEVMYKNRPNPIKEILNMK